MNGHTELSKYWPPLTDNPNAPNNDGFTPSFVAAKYEIVKILANLTQSPNAPNNQSGTPASIARNAKNL